MLNFDRCVCERLPIRERERGGYPRLAARKFVFYTSFPRKEIHPCEGEFLNAGATPDAQKGPATSQAGAACDLYPSLAQASRPHPGQVCRTALRGIGNGYFRWAAIAD